MFSNKKSVYVDTHSGDQILLEIEEHHGWISVSHNGKRIDISPDSIYDLVDAFTMVANEVTSHTGEW